MRPPEGLTFDEVGEGITRVLAIAQLAGHQRVEVSTLIYLHEPETFPPGVRFAVELLSGIRDGSVADLIDKYSIGFDSADMDDLWSAL